MTTDVKSGPEYVVPTQRNLEEGTYPAVLRSVEAREGVDQATGLPRVYWSWGFVIDVDGEEVVRSANSSALLTPKSKGGRWAKALLGGDIPTGRFDWSSILGRRCLITIEHAETDNGTFDRVVNVVAQPKRRVDAADTPSRPMPESAGVHGSTTPPARRSTFAEAMDHERAADGDAF
jgi:hypothetical protein